MTVMCHLIIRLHVVLLSFLSINAFITTKSYTRGSLITKHPPPSIAKKSPTNNPYFWHLPTIRDQQKVNKYIPKPLGAASTDTPTSSSPASSSADFNWTEEWYPILPIQDLNMATPNKVTLLGKDFVVWYHQPSESWRAFADACPHRLVPLSEGRLDGDKIQCAYRTY